jgi:hypothetical protein
VYTNHVYIIVIVALVVSWGGGIGVCRHENVLTFCNMKGTGERYSYVHYLILAKLLPYYVIQKLFYDVMCKFKPYALNVHKALEQRMLVVRARRQRMPRLVP